VGRHREETTVVEAVDASVHGRGRGLAVLGASGGCHGFVGGRDEDPSRTLVVEQREDGLGSEILVHGPSLSRRALELSTEFAAGAKRSKTLVAE